MLVESLSHNLLLLSALTDPSKPAFKVLSLPWGSVHWGAWSPVEQAKDKGARTFLSALPVGVLICLYLPTVCPL